jgi:hypothetical protein
MGTTCFLKSDYANRSEEVQKLWIGPRIRIRIRINDADEQLDRLILRALNKIKKPSTAEEITELLNRELGQRDRPFDEKEVETWLRKARDKVIPLY